MRMLSRSWAPRFRVPDVTPEKETRGQWVDLEYYNIMSLENRK
jgi:hypothetical protein